MTKLFDEVQALVSEIDDQQAEITALKAEVKKLKGVIVSAHKENAMLWAELAKLTKAYNGEINKQ